MSVLQFVKQRAVVAATLTILSSGTLLGAAPAPQAAPPAVAPPSQTLSAAARMQISELLAEKEARSSAQRKMDSQLIYAAKMATGQPIAAAASTLNSTLRITLPTTDDGRVKLELRATVSETLLTTLRALGAEVVATNAQYSSVRVNVALGKIESIAALPDVLFVRPRSEPIMAMKSPGGGPFDWNEWNRAWRHRPRVEATTSTTTTEGDVTHNAAKARSIYGVTGANVKVCVISDGIDNLSTRQSIGDLGSVTWLPGQAGSGNEGTAMLEIIHEMAPNAQLFFATSQGGIPQFAQNIKDLAKYGCQIFVDDVDYGEESPFQNGQDPAYYGQGKTFLSDTNGGLITQTVKDLVRNTDSANNGPIYITSAGNRGNATNGTSGVWEGMFKDGGAATGKLAGRGEVHDFGGGQTYARVSLADGLRPNFVTLYWSDPLGGGNATGGAEADYDLFLLDDNDQVIALSTNVQDGYEDPYEVLVPPPNSGSTGKLVVVLNTNTRDRNNSSYWCGEFVGVPGCTRFLHLDVNRTGAGLYPSTGGAIRGHAGADDTRVWAIASTPAAALGSNALRGPYPQPFSPDNVVEPDSSDGDRRVFFGPRGPFDVYPSGGTVFLGRPTFTAADAVSTAVTLPTGHVFVGTSAAAAHVAAIAALTEEKLAQFGGCNQPGCVTFWSAFQRYGVINIMGSDPNAAPNVADGPGWNRNAGWGIPMADLTVCAIVNGANGCPPVIHLNPASQTICPTCNATFSVTASGNGPLDYFWFQGPRGTTASPLNSDITSNSLLVDGSLGTTQVWVRVTDVNGLSTDSGTAGLTVQGAPVVTTGVASNISTTSAQLNATVNPSNNPTTAFFEYGPSLDFGTTTAAVAIGSGTTDMPITAAATNLACNTVYFFRADANNGVSAKGYEETFLTPPCPTMSLDKTGLAFAATTTGAAFTSATGAQAVRLVQTGTGTVTWTATSSAPWLVVSPASGTGTATLNVSVQFAAGLSPTQTGAITVVLTGASGAVGPISATLSLSANGASAAPSGSFDTPTNGATGVAGSIPVTGWALDDIQVTRVTICRDAVSGETATVDPNCGNNAKIYVGDAVFVDGARPDIQSANPTLPFNSRAGWGYLMLTDFLPALGNGTFTLNAYAFDADGHTTLLGRKSITCANSSSTAPFGAIDQPAQGAVISGAAYANFGWVLAKGPNFADPPDGGTVQVFVDGNLVGSPAGWTSRSDLTGLFPASAYPGIASALGVFGLNTTSLTNGVHTIYWIATGTGGIGASGIGSRFITVSNGSSLFEPPASGGLTIASRPLLDVPGAATSRLVSSSSLASEIAAAAADLSAVQGRRGYDVNSPLRTYAASSGRIDVQAEELDRIELHLSDTSGHLYSGYLQTPSGLQPMPVGSSLDPETGAFTWMPGVGFYGVYDLRFVRWSDGHAVARQDVRITLNAKGSNRVGPQTIIDAPAADAVSVPSDAFYIGGWAADLDSSVDSGVSTVHVWAYPVDASGARLDPIFLGPAIYGGARPDVAAVYGDRFANTGYGTIVTSVPPGTYDLAVFAYSTVQNTFTPAAVVRVVVR